MKIFTSCQDAIRTCLETETYAIAHLYQTDKTLDMHIHNCHEIYYSISGGKQFLIDDHLYDFKAGDIFFINNHESHCLSKFNIDSHERIVISIHPNYLRQLNTESTNLEHCFHFRDTGFSHKISLTAKDQKQFQYMIHRFSNSSQFGLDILDKAIFMELMVFLNKLFLQHHQCLTKEPETFSKRHAKVASILSYINQHLADELSINILAEEFYLSPSYLSSIFKKETGTTINKYITSQRITLAKQYLTDGFSVTDTYSLCGFNDYSNFLKTFTKLVGISPKKYAQFSSQ